MVRNKLAAQEKKGEARALILNYLLGVGGVGERTTGKRKRCSTVTGEGREARLYFLPGGMEKEGVKFEKEGK